MSTSILADGRFIIVDKTAEESSYLTVCHLILLDEHKRSSFERKLKEYKARIGNPNIDRADISFRILLIERLLEDGMVSPWKTMLDNGMPRNASTLNAASVVAIYAQSGRNGTGTGF